MKLSEAFPSNFLKSEDLQDRDVTVVIAGAELELVGNERKLILTFQGKKKTMICNKTNAGRIAFLYGDDTDEWVGKEIILTAEFVEFQGKTVKGLRVKAPPRKTEPAQHKTPDRGGYATHERVRDGLQEALDEPGDFR
jgi:hypothetical protein